MMTHDVTAQAWTEKMFKVWSRVSESRGWLVMRLSLLAGLKQKKWRLSAGHKRAL
jgi:hypothetical protein